LTGGVDIEELHMKTKNFSWLASLVLILLSLSIQTSWAQHQGSNADSQHGNGNSDQQQEHAGHGQGDGDGQMMHSAEEHQAMMQRMMQNRAGSMANSNGQASVSTAGDMFSSIREIVRQLEADPETDWDKVNIDALREHFIDMNHVSLYANVVSEEVSGGAQYLVTGEGRTLAAILNMVPTHANQISTESELTVQIKRLENGVELIVTGNSAIDTARIRGLGFMGFLVTGDHHEAHHMLIAGGSTDQDLDSGHSH
jgi:hypothetical protein